MDGLSIRNILRRWYISMLGAVRTWGMKWPPAATIFYTAVVSLRIMHWTTPRGHAMQSSTPAGWCPFRKFSSTPTSPRTPCARTVSPVATHVTQPVKAGLRKYAARVVLWEMKALDVGFFLVKISVLLGPPAAKRCRMNGAEWSSIAIHKGFQMSVFCWDFFYCKLHYYE